VPHELLLALECVLQVQVQALEVLHGGHLLHVLHERLPAPRSDAGSSSFWPNQWFWFSKNGSGSGSGLVLVLVLMFEHLYRAHYQVDSATNRMMMVLARACQCIEFTAVARQAQSSDIHF